MTAPETRVVLAADLQHLADLLAERTYGNKARSPAHNARLMVEDVLAAAPAAPAHEPVGEIHRGWIGDCRLFERVDDTGFPDGTPLYTAPPAPVAASAVDALAIDAAIAAAQAMLRREDNPEAARWPCDYDDDEVAVERASMGRAVAAYLAATTGADNPAADLIVNDREVSTVRYRNWRGEIAERHIVPLRIWYGSTEWHPEPQLLLTAWDADKQAERDFAMADFLPREGEPGHGWRDISSARDREMIVARAINVTLPSGQTYTSDPYVVWRQDGSYARWPHDFPPTHFVPLPPPPAAEGE